MIKESSSDWAKTLSKNTHYLKINYENQIPIFNDSYKFIYVYTYEFNAMTNILIKFNATSIKLFELYGLNSNGKTLSLFLDDLFGSVKLGNWWFLSSDLFS